MPRLAELEGKWRPRGLHVAFVAVGEDPADLQAFLRDVGVSVPVLRDDEGAAALVLLPESERRQLSPGSLPVAINVLLDARGQVVWTEVRGRPGADPSLAVFERVLADLLPEPR